MNKTLIVMTFSLAILAMLTMLFSFFALQDIYNNFESDLTAEWNMVRANFLVLFFFIVFSMLTLFKVLKNNSLVRHPEPNKLS